MHSFTLISALAGASLVLAKPHAAPAAAPMITPAPMVNMVKPALERRQGNIDECMDKAKDIFADADPPGVSYSSPLGQFLSEQGDKFQELPPTDVEGLCSVQFPASSDVPGPVQTAYSAFMSASASWVSRIKPSVTSLAKSCGGPISAGIEIVLATDYDSCSTLFGAYFREAEALATSMGEAFGNTASPAPTGTTAVKPAETGSGSDDDSDNNDNGSNNNGSNNNNSDNDNEEAEATSSTSTAGAPRETGYVVAAAAAVVAVAGAMAL